MVSNPGYGLPLDQRWDDLIWSGRYQEAWDYLIVWSWEYRSYASPYGLLRQMERRGAQVGGLRRLPPPYYRGKVRDFIGNYLPKLSERMFSRASPIRDETLWLIAGAVSRSRMDSCPSLAHGRDNRERNATKREYLAARMSDALYMEFRDGLRDGVNRVHRARNAGRLKA